MRKLPCTIAGKNVSIRTEVVEAHFLFLVGNTTLKKANAISYIMKNEVELLGVKVAMKETKRDTLELRKNTKG